MRLDLHGLIAAPFTPFNADGSLAVAAIDPLCAHLVADGVAGAFVCGTTGEGTALSVVERQQVAERWRQVAPPGFRVLVHVGALALGDARALAAHAEHIGADGVAVMPPCFLKPGDTAAVVDWIAAVAAACPRTPVTYYHIPALSGVNLRIDELLRQGLARIGNFAGVKFTHMDLHDYGRCLAEYGERCDIAFGRDEMLVSALALGARVAVGSTYNLAAPLYQRIIAAMARGDLAAARRDQDLACRLIDVLIRHRTLPALKALMARRGVPCGPCRLPLPTLTESEVDVLCAELDQAGLLTLVLPAAASASAAS